MTNGSSLISGYFDGTLSDAEVGELNSWIVADPANAKLFAKHAMLHHHIHVTLAGERALRIEHAERPPMTGCGATAEFEKASTRTSDRMGGAFGGAVKRGPWRHYARAGWAAAAALLFACGVAAFNYYESRPFGAVNGEADALTSSAPAYITGDAGAKWEGLEDANERGLPASQAITLTDGYAELTFAGGAMVVLQAPATFSIQSGAAMMLSSGRLAATMNGGGFIVSTPTAKVTDLGTEFGVDVTDAAGTEVDVFKGRVVVEGLEKATAGHALEKHILKAGEAGTYHAAVFAMNAQGATPDRFVRNFSAVTTSLDVVDLICGGDGTTHRRGTGIDILKGEAGELKQVGREVGDHHYHRLAALAVVDGCFIPDGKTGAMTIDSAGHKYKFPSTTNVSQGLLSVGGRPLDPFGNGLTGTELGGTDYSEPGHGELFMYSNKGLTLDLAAIKRLDPTKNFYEFRCTVGSTFLKIMRAQRTAPRADVYVLVDGRLRFSRVGLTNKTGPFTIDVPLNENDRFLTLVTTDGGDTRRDDYIIWADPSLQTMAPPKKTDAVKSQH